MAKKEYITTIKSITEVIPGTFEVRLVKPKDYHFTAGQYTEIHLINALLKDPKGNFRPFSIPSAPHEEDLMFIMRNSQSIFKNQLFKLNPGDEVIIQEPEGEFVLPEKSEREIIFLIGGIGITPIRSMLQEAVYRRLSLRTTTFYSNLSPETTAFFDELKNLPQDQHRIIFTMTGMENSKMKWDGETSRIDGALLEKYEPNFHEKQFYIVGPLGFVSAMVKLTRELKIPFSQVKLESFGVYEKGV